MEAESKRIDSTILNDGFTQGVPLITLSLMVLITSFQSTRLFSQDAESCSIQEKV